MKTFALLLALALAGCAAPLEERTATYNEAEYARYAGRGTAKIHGQAFLKTVGGDVKYGAGSTVYLYPVTSMTTEWYDKFLVQGKSLKAGDDRMMKYSRQIVADGTGNFEFEGLPAGDYYLVCNIFWGVPTGLTFAPIGETGGAVHTKVIVAAGENKRVILTAP